MTAHTKEVFMNLSQAQTALQNSQQQFATTAKLPNNLERNLVLAEHRTEIARLEKLIGKCTKAGQTA